MLKISVYAKGYSVSKSRVKTSFTKAIKSYENHIYVQKQTAVKLSELSKDLKGFGIDLGCGTGILSTLLDKNVIGLDISFSMAKSYKDKNLKVVVGDIENIPFKANTFDFAVSNFALHWTNLEKSFKEISRVLKKEGKFLFCMPIENSFKVVEEILGEKNFDFVSVETLLKMLSYNFDIQYLETKEYNLEFKSGLDLLLHLHLTGSSVGKVGSTVGEKRKIYKKFSSYKKPLTLNFNVVFIKAVNLQS